MVCLSLASQIDNGIANRLRAANQKIVFSGLVERLWSVGHRSRDQTALTALTDTGPARPTKGASHASANSKIALVDR